MTSAHWHVQHKRDSADERVERVWVFVRQSLYMLENKLYRRCSLDCSGTEWNIYWLASVKWANISGSTSSASLFYASSIPSRTTIMTRRYDELEPSQRSALDVAALDAPYSYLRIYIQRWISTFLNCSFAHFFPQYAHVYQIKIEINSAFTDLRQLSIAGMSCYYFT